MEWDRERWGRGAVLGNRDPEGLSEDVMLRVNTKKVLRRE